MKFLIGLFLFVFTQRMLCTISQHPMVTTDDVDDEVGTAITFSSMLASIEKDPQASAALMSPLSNGNWRQRDFSSKIRLGFGRPLRSTPTTVGATFRRPKDMLNKDGSCQYWKNDTLDFVDPGYNPYLVGVGYGLWQTSMSCGQCYLIYNPNTNHATVSMVTDYCPPPCSRNQLDIQSSASAFLASGDSYNTAAYNGGPENYDSLLIWPVECDWKGKPLGYYMDTGSSRFHWYLIVYWMTVPISSMQVYKMDSTYTVTLFTADVKGHDTYGRWVVEFYGQGGAGHYKLVLGAVNNTRMIEDRIYWNGAVGARVRGINNFPVTSTASNIKNWPMP